MEEQNLNVPWEGWKCVKPIGKGGYGTVYEIQRTQHGITEKAAMKKISIPQSADEVDNLRIEGYDDESITQRFSGFAEEIIREYGMMIQMKGNANVVYCDDYKIIQQDDGFGQDIYIKMELLTPLVKALDQVSTEEQIIRFGMDMCNGLEVCQKRKVIHRDIKPQNIFVSEDGVFKLGDFGIARTAERTTRATVGIGTYQFMAPEVLNNQPYGSTVDIYSLGLVMYWLLNARRSPFLPLPPAVPKHGEEEQARQRRFAGERIPEPRDGSKELKRIVLKACAFDPKDRYQSAKEMREDLQRLSGAALSAPAVQLQQNSLAAQETEPSKEATVGPVFTRNVSSVAEESDKTVGPTFDKRKVVPEEDPEKTVGPQFTVKTQKKTEKKPDKKQKNKLWKVMIAAVVVFIIVLSVIKIGSVNRKTQMEMPSTSLPNVQKEERKLMSLIATPIHALGRYSDGSVEVIHNSGDGIWDAFMRDITEYTGLINVVGTSGHALGLRDDGTVVAVGTNDSGECNVETWSNIVSVAAGAWMKFESSDIVSVGHTLGLRADGTVVATGDNTYNQCNVGEWTDMVQIVAGDGYSLGLKADGRVLFAGDPSQYAASNFAAEIVTWQNVQRLCLRGESHIVAITADGMIFEAGFHLGNRCNFSGWNDIVDIASGSGFTVGLKKDGTVVATGDNEWGQCDVSEWTDIVAIGTGMCHTVGLKSDGTIVVAGLKPDKYDISKLVGVRQIVVGNYYTSVLTKDGQAIAWAHN